jgi:hypothetical protein
MNSKHEEAKEDEFNFNFGNSDPKPKEAVQQNN